jgi:exonuclease III
VIRVFYEFEHVSRFLTVGSSVCRTESIRWRIDYQLARGDLAARAKQAVVERAAAYDQRWSDHAPVTVQYR